MAVEYRGRSCAAALTTKPGSGRSLVVGERLGPGERRVKFESMPQTMFGLELQ
jgi:hypothetical protein